MAIYQMQMDYVGQFKDYLIKKRICYTTAGLAHNQYGYMEVCLYNYDR